MSSVEDEAILTRSKRNVDENVNNVCSRKDSPVSGAVVNLMGGLYTHDVAGILTIAVHFAILNT